MRRGPGSAVFANPVLVGAITLLVVNVATVLAWFANRGLPFVPTKQVKVEVTSGANLLPGNDVREGGFRIGIVKDMQPKMLPNGEVGAVATLQLDQNRANVPVDSTVNLRPRSVLGLKYVELMKGRSNTLLRDGDTLPYTQARYPVELDEFEGIFDEETRNGSRRNLRGFGDAFARRGVSLNTTIAGLPRFLEHLQPVMKTLSESRIDRFFGELGDFTRVVKPVADRYAHSFEAGADTFEAWSRHPEELKQTISKSWRSMDEGIASFRVQRPFLVTLRDFSIELDRAASELPRTLPRIIPALEEGIPVLRRSPEINEETRKTLQTLEDLMRQPSTGASFRGLGDTVGILNPVARFVGPYITVCNYFNYSFTHIGEHLTEPDPTGGAQRTLINQAPQQFDPRNGQRTGVTTLGAPYVANGGVTASSGGPTAQQQHLHTNNYTAAVTDTGEADCESGQRGYMRRNAEYWPQGYDIVVDPHTPGVQGTTFSGRPRVPEGQTFDRNPKIGPQMPAELDAG